MSVQGNVNLLVPFSAQEIDYIDMLIEVKNKLFLDYPMIKINIYTAVNWRNIPKNDSVAIVAHGNPLNPNVFSSNISGENIIHKNVVFKALQDCNITVWKDFSCGTSTHSLGVLLNLDISVAIIIEEIKRYCGYPSYDFGGQAYWEVKIELERPRLTEHNDR